MHNIRIKVADTTIEINTLFHKAYKMLVEYVDYGEPDLFIQCTYEDLDREKEAYEAEFHRKAPGDIQLEVFALLHKISDELVDRSIFLMHGAAIALDNKAYIFTANSGTGKTTHIQKWILNDPDVFVINGDKPFIKVSGDNSPLLACGSPWAGKENMQTNTMVPIKAIIRMERSEDNHIERISFVEAFPALLQQIYWPTDRGRMRKPLHLLKELEKGVSFWSFHFNNYKDDCFEIAYKTLVGCS